MREIVETPVSGLRGIGIKVLLFTTLEPLQGGGQDELHHRMMHGLASEVAMLQV